MSHHRRHSKRRIVRLGTREIHADGVERSFWNDLYHNSMTASWPQFFLGLAVVFFALNSFFATLYFMGDHAIANVNSDSFVDHLFFSIETLATVGYGNMHPQTTYGHSIATIEIFVGMSLIAVMTGLIFARFSRPQARLIFARHPVVGPHDGKPHLMFRVGNARTNNLTDARAKLWLVRNEQSLEGSTFRRFYRLPLRHAENPVFSLSWLLLHHIDENSMLYGLDAAALKKSDASFIVSITAIDENAAQEVHVRHSFTHEDLRWNHIFVDIIDASKSPKLYVDYNKLHDVKPVK